MVDDGTVVQSESELVEGKRASGGAPELPGYTLQYCLGRGSFGEVWSGLQLRTQQQVAVKILRGHNLRSFSNELERLREVAEHPYIVSLLDADLDHQPAYLVMPWLRQGSLAGVTTPVSLRQLEVWLGQLTAALQFTHNKGLLHCDLKPSNVLLDDEGQLRLVDFGQSTRLGGERALGTLGYMAPEQARLGSEERNSTPNVGWDIYALGALAYYLLGGQVPRLVPQDLRSLSGSTEHVLESYHRLVRSRPLRPLRELNSRVDADLAAIIQSCLALDPERRPQTIQEVVQDLENRRLRNPLLCRRPWSLGYQVRCFVSKPLVAIILFFSVVLLAGGIAGYRHISGQNQILSTQVGQQYRQRGMMALAQNDPQQALLWFAWARQYLPDSRELAHYLRPPAHLWRWTHKLDSPAEAGRLTEHYLVLRTKASQLVVLDRSNGQELWRAAGPFQQMVVDPAEQAVALTGPSLQILDLATGRPLTKPLAGFGKFSDAQGGPEPAAVFPEPGRLLAINPAGRLIEWRFPGPCRTLAEFGSETIARFSSDGRLVAHANFHWRQSDSTAVEVFDIQQRRKIFRVERELVSGLVFLPGGRLLIKATTMSVVNLSNGTASELSSLCQDLVVTPDGRWLAVQEDSGVIRVFGLDKLSVKSTWIVPGGVSQMQVSNQTLAISARDGSGAVYRLPQGQFLSGSFALGSSDGVLLNGGPSLVVLAGDGAVRFYDENELPSEVLQGVLGAVSPDGRLRVTNSQSSTRVFEQGSLLYEVPGYLFFSEFTPDGNQLVLGGGRRLLLLQSRSGQVVRSWDLPGDLGLACKDPSGPRLIVNTEGSQPSWQIELEGKRVRLPDHFRASFSPDGQWLAVVERQAKASRVRLGRADQLPRLGDRAIPMDESEVFLNLSWNAGGQYLCVTGVTVGSARIWPVPGARVFNPGPDCTGVAVNAEGTRAASVSERGRLQFYRLPDFQPDFEVEVGRGQGPSSLSFLPKSDLIVVERDEQIRIYDTHTGVPLTGWFEGTYPIGSPDGRQLFLQFRRHFTKVVELSPLLAPGPGPAESIVVSQKWTGLQLDPQAGSIR